MSKNFSFSWLLVKIGACKLQILQITILLRKLFGDLTYSEKLNVKPCKGDPRAMSNIYKIAHYFHIKVLCPKYVLCPNWVLNTPLGKHLLETITLTSDDLMRAKTLMGQQHSKQVTNANPKWFGGGPCIITGCAWA